MKVVRIKAHALALVSLQPCFLQELDSTALRPIIVELKAIVRAYRELSLAPVDYARASRNKKLPLDGLSKRMTKRQFPRLGLVPVLSHALPVAADARYVPEEFPRVDSIDGTVTFVGGINLPKLITVRDQFGQVRRRGWVAHSLIAPFSPALILTLDLRRCTGSW